DLAHHAVGRARGGGGIAGDAVAVRGRALPIDAVAVAGRGRGQAIDARAVGREARPVDAGGGAIGRGGHADDRAARRRRRQRVDAQRQPRGGGGGPTHARGDRRAALPVETVAGAAGPGGPAQEPGAVVDDLQARPAERTRPGLAAVVVVAA